MKAERRHELEHNELADSMTLTTKWLQDNALGLISVIGLAILIVVGYNLIYAEKPIDAPAGDWNKYFAAIGDPNADKELEVLIDSASDKNSPAMIQAQYVLGDWQLAQGCKNLFEDRKVAVEFLEKAEKNLSEVEKRTTDAFIKNATRLKLGATYEALNKADDAQKFYEMVAKTGAESIHGKEAMRAVQRIKSKDSRDLLAWLEKQKPLKRNPHTGMPDMSVPETKDFSLPELNNATGAQPRIPLAPLSNEKVESSEKTEPENAKTEDNTKTPAATTEAVKSEPTTKESTEPKTVEPKEPLTVEPAATEPKATEPKVETPVAPKDAPAPTTETNTANPK
jgi:predicted negative regulator of RcsB-dependent stress response